MDKKPSSKDPENQESAATKLMADDRFKRLFTDKEFQIDQTTEAYKFQKSGNVNKKLK